MTINGKDVSMFCGDTEAFIVSCKQGTTVRPFVTGDKVFFAIKEYAAKKDKVVKKTITEFIDGKARVELLPADTSNVMPGDYVYYVTVSFADNTRKTVVGPAVFTLLAGVTDE